MRYWLMKSEPEEFSIDALAKKKKEPWNGVRNYQARNYMRDDMKVGDGVLFYHSNCAEPGVVGLAAVPGGVDGVGPQAVADRVVVVVLARIPGPPQGLQRLGERVADLDWDGQQAAQGAEERYDRVRDGRLGVLVGEQQVGALQVQE